MIYPVVWTLLNLSVARLVWMPYYVKRGRTEKQKSRSVAWMLIFALWSMAVILGLQIYMKGE